MTELTPQGVVHGLMELSRQLDELSRGLDLLERDAVNAREDYTLAYAKAFLDQPANATMDVRRYQATVDTHAERLAAETAEMLVRGRRRQLQTLSTRIEVGRSAAAALRAEIALER